MSSKKENILEQMQLHGYTDRKTIEKGDKEMIKSMYAEKKIVYSLEVFPPKADADIQTIFTALDAMKEVDPDYISVTYGAGGSNSGKTLEIASYIQNECGIEAVSHLTCAALTPQKLQFFLGELKEKRVKNILALRGDKPLDMTEQEFESRYFKHASDLVKAIDKHPLGSIGGACYPEIHPESANRATDIRFLKEKTEAGMDFLITQLFYDNSVFYKFMEEVERSGISVPIAAGIMPVTAASQIKRTVELSGSKVPDKLSRLLAKYRDNAEDLRKAGIEFAINQIEDLQRHGVRGIHLYSMNKADVAKEVFDTIK